MENWLEAPLAPARYLCSGRGAHSEHERPDEGYGKLFASRELKWFSGNILDEDHSNFYGSGWYCQSCIMSILDASRGAIRNNSDPVFGPSLADEIVRRSALHGK